MKVIKTYKYQLRPSKGIEVKFYQVLGTCRLIYNLCLEYRQLVYQELQKSVGKTELQKEVKRCLSYLPEVNAELMKNKQNE